VAAIQIAKLFGARVIAAASNGRKIAAARTLGADETIDYTAEELVGAVKRLTDRRGADIVVEHTGAATFPKSIVSCARGGRIVTCGATAGYEATLNLRHVFWRHLSIMGSTLAPKSCLFDIADRVAAGQLRPVVDRVLPLAEIQEAHRALEAREAFGKIVLTLD
jgi:NADPH:quinone reductase-like Zn-dependent oxidoreductase